MENKHPLPSPNGHYPYVIFKEGACEIIACSPTRYRILWQGKPQGWRKYFSEASRYCINEGLVK